MFCNIKGYLLELSVHKRDRIIKFITQEEKKLASVCTDREKMNLLNNIIRMKKDIYTNEKYQDNIYSNIKDWIKHYILTIDNNNYKYDFFDKYKIEKMIQLLSFPQQIILYKYLIRQLKINAHTNDKILWCEERIKKTEIKLLLSECSLGNSIRLLFAVSSYNLQMLLFTFILLVVFINIIFLPKEYLGIELFTLEYAHYNEDFIINHIVNITNYLFNFYNDGFNIITDSLFTIVLLLIIKISFYLIIINFIVKQITRSISQYE